MDFDIIQELQEWFKNHCDGDWEHNCGLKIETIDNPGWYISIDLFGTKLENMSFVSDIVLRNEAEWHDITIRDGKFIGVGSPGKLLYILQSFITFSKIDI